MGLLQGDHFFRIFNLRSQQVSVLESHVERRSLQVHENSAILRGPAEGALHVRIEFRLLGEKGQGSRYKSQAGQEKSQSAHSSLQGHRCSLALSENP